MKNSLYIIEYELHQQPKSFIIRAEVMNNAEAWHWACCDAGIGIIPRSRNEKIKRISKPWRSVMALRRSVGVLQAVFRLLQNPTCRHRLTKGGIVNNHYCFLRRSCNKHNF